MATCEIPVVVKATISTEGESDIERTRTVYIPIDMESIIVRPKNPLLAKGTAFTRASEATVIDWLGYVQTAFVNELRVEGARRVVNLIKIDSSSNGLSTLTNVTRSGSLITETSGTGEHLCYYSGSTNIEQSILFEGFSQVKIKGGTRRYVNVTMFHTAERAGVVVDTQTGEITDTSTDKANTFLLDYGISDADADGYYTVWIKTRRTSGVIAELYPMTSGSGANTTPGDFSDLPTSTGDGTWYAKDWMVERAYPGQLKPSEFVSVGEGITAPDARVIHHGFGVDRVKYFTDYPPQNMLTDSGSGWPGFPADEHDNDDIMSGPDSNGWITVSKATTDTGERIWSEPLTGGGGLFAEMEFLGTPTASAIYFGFFANSVWSGFLNAYEIVSGPGTIVEAPGQPSTSALKHLSGLSEETPTKVRFWIETSYSAQILIYPGTAEATTIGTAIKYRNLTVVARPGMFTGGYDEQGDDNKPIPTDVLKGMLVEGATSTNLVRTSQTFDGTGWNKTLCGVTTGLTGGPVGEYAKIYENNTGTKTWRLGNFSPYVSGKTYTAWGVFKAAERSLVGIRTATTFSDSSVIFDLSTGTVGARVGSFESDFIRDLGAGWYICGVTVTATSTGEGLIGVQPRTTLVGSYELRAGEPSKGFYCAHFQVELSPSRSSLIKTTSATVTRSADELTVTHGLTGFDEVGRVDVSLSELRSANALLPTALVGSSDVDHDILYAQAGGVATTDDGTNIVAKSGSNLLDGDPHVAIASWSGSSATVTVDNSSEQGVFKGTTEGDSSSLNVLIDAYGTIKELRVSSD